MSDYTPTDAEIRAGFISGCAPIIYRSELGIDVRKSEAIAGAGYDRWLAAHDAAHDASPEAEVRERVAREIEAEGEKLASAQIRTYGYLPRVQSGIVAGYECSARIARGEDTK